MTSRPDVLEQLRDAEAAVRLLPAALADALSRLERAARHGAAGELADAGGLVVLDPGWPALLLLADDVHGYLLAALPLEATAAAADRLDRGGSAPAASHGDRVLAFVRSRAEPVTAADVAGDVPGVDVDQARVYLSRLCRAGRIERIRRGAYVPAQSERNRRNNPTVSAVSSHVNARANQRTTSTREAGRPGAAVAVGEPDWPRIAESLCGALDEDGTPTTWPFIVHTRAALTCETPECGRPVRRRAYRGAPVHCGQCWSVAAAAALPGQSEAPSSGVAGDPTNQACLNDGEARI